MRTQKHSLALILKLFTQSHSALWSFTHSHRRSYAALAFETENFEKRSMHSHVNFGAKAQCVVCAKCAVVLRASNNTKKQNTYPHQDRHGNHKHLEGALHYRRFVGRAAFVSIAQ